MGRGTRRGFLATTAAAGLTIGAGRVLAQPAVFLAAPNEPDPPAMRVETDLADLATVAIASIDPAAVSTYPVYVSLATTNLTSNDHDLAEITAETVFEVAQGGELLLAGVPAGQVCRMHRAGDSLELRRPDGSVVGHYPGPLLARTIDPARQVELRSVTRTISSIGTFHPRYRGQLEVKRAGLAGKVNLTSVLTPDRMAYPLEEYLYAVVPLEMPVDYGAEALKAQAVAARGYAASRYSGGAIRICDSTSCQAYYGTQAEKPAGIDAVDRTRGVVATYDGKVISAQYSACCGGHTENNEHVYSSSAVAYLRGVRCEHDRAPLNLVTEEAAATFWRGTPPGFCDWSTSLYRWQRYWTRQDLEAVINAHLTGGQLGELSELQVLARGVSGKIRHLRIVNRSGAFWDVIGDYNVRRVLRTSVGAGLQLSSNLVFEYERAGATLVAVRAYGGGWGHGVGMCQRGARGMAAAGYRYDQILTHYYSGIRLEGGLLPPPAPRPTAPSDGSLVLSTASVVLAWEGETAEYEGELWNRDVEVQAATRAWSGDTAWSVGTLPAGHYEWRVRGRNGADSVSDYCAWQRLVSTDHIHNVRIPVASKNSEVLP